VADGSRARGEDGLGIVLRECWPGGISTVLLVLCIVYIAPCIASRAVGALGKAVVEPFRSENKGNGCLSIHGMLGGIAKPCEVWGRSGAPFDMAASFRPERGGETRRFRTCLNGKVIGRGRRRGWNAVPRFFFRFFWLGAAPSGPKAAKRGVTFGLSTGRRYRLREVMGIHRLAIWDTHCAKQKKTKTAVGSARVRGTEWRSPQQVPRTTGSLTKQLGKSVHSKTCNLFVKKGSPPAKRAFLVKLGGHSFRSLSPNPII